MAGLTPAVFCIQLIFITLRCTFRRRSARVSHFDEIGTCKLLQLELMQAGVTVAVAIASAHAAAAPAARQPLVWGRWRVHLLILLHPLRTPGVGAVRAVSIWSGLSRSTASQRPDGG